MTTHFKNHSRRWMHMSTAAIYHCAKMHGTFITSTRDNCGLSDRYTKCSGRGEGPKSVFVKAHLHRRLREELELLVCWKNLSSPSFLCARAGPAAEVHRRVSGTGLYNPKPSTPTGEAAEMQAKRRRCIAW